LRPQAFAKSPLDKYYNTIQNSNFMVRPLRATSPALKKNHPTSP